MGLFDIFRSKQPEADPLADLVLDRMKVGFLVDYDLATWTVTAYNRYDFDGDAVEEWELTEGHRKRYLERGEDDGVHWALSKKIPIGSIDGDVRSQVLDHGDPPQRVTYQGTEYFLDDSAAGHMMADGDGAPQELIKWEYLDEEGEKYLTVEQWGETELEASAGVAVHEYQFENILPGS